MLELANSWWRLISWPSAHGRGLDWWRQPGLGREKTYPDIPTIGSSSHSVLSRVFFHQAFGFRRKLVPLARFDSDNWNEKGRVDSLIVQTWHIRHRELRSTGEESGALRESREKRIISGKWRSAAIAWMSSHDLLSDLLPSQINPPRPHLLLYQTTRMVWFGFAVTRFLVKVTHLSSVAWLARNCCIGQRHHRTLPLPVLFYCDFPRFCRSHEQRLSSVAVWMRFWLSFAWILFNYFNFYILKL